MVQTTTKVKVEIRESTGMLHATLLQEGRAASGGRRELFTPGAVIWPSTGVRILTQHEGRTHATAFPVRDAEGRIQVRVRATPELRKAVKAGHSYMSVEFRALEERRTAGGVREILSALVDAATLTDVPEYDTTSAELRKHKQRKPRRSGL